MERARPVRFGVPVGAENEWTVWHHAGVGPPRVRISARGGEPRNGKVLRKTGVAEHQVRPKGAVVMRTKAWGKVLRTQKRMWCLMMGGWGSEERVCLGVRVCWKSTGAPVRI